METFAYSRNCQTLGVSPAKPEVYPFELNNHYSKSHPVMKQFYRILPWLMNGAWSKLKSKLDTDYHRLITDDEFKTHRHIYYNLEERYKKMEVQ